MVYRGDTCVFSDLSFVLEEDKHTAILGPNGAGKSTILKLLAGEVHCVPREETSIRVFGEQEWNVWDVRKRLGLVSHDLQHQYMEQVTGLKVVSIRVLREYRNIRASGVYLCADRSGPFRHGGFGNRPADRQKVCRHVDR